MRLEENFKKFTDNLYKKRSSVHQPNGGGSGKANQSMQVISSHDRSSAFSPVNFTGFATNKAGINFCN